MKRIWTITLAVTAGMLIGCSSSDSDDTSSTGGDTTGADVITDTTGSDANDGATGTTATDVSF